jgi:hypothetical protein
MALVYIASVTASSSASVSFTSGIDSTYNEYQFHFVNIHPQTDSAQFQFQVNAAGASGFNEEITSTAFRAYHNEGDTGTSLSYDAGADLAQGTGYQNLTAGNGSDNDQATAGMLSLYAPSSTTYVKHFMSLVNDANEGDYINSNYRSGYINITTAVDEISFKYNTGNIDAGSIHMYGVG